MEKEERLTPPDFRFLRGEPGVGKTRIVEGFAQLLAEGKLPDALGRPAVIEISLTSLVGRKGRFRWLGFGVSPSREKCGGHRRAATGEFEERLEAVVREASCGTAFWKR